MNDARRLILSRSTRSLTRAEMARAEMARAEIARGRGALENARLRAFGQLSPGKCPVFSNSSNKRLRHNPPPYPVSSPSLPITR